MIPRSYASDESGGKPRWLLFARQKDVEESEEIVLTAVVTLGHRNVVAEKCVDQDTLQQHSEELGLEMDTTEFKTLMLKALEQRSCVDVGVEVAEDESVAEIFLSLTYKFSPTISRKGLFQLPIVATDAPSSLVVLLTSIHSTPPQPMLSGQQQRKKTEMRSLPVVDKSGASEPNKKANVTAIQDTGAPSAAQSVDTGTATTAVNPMLLKRRHVPTGTMRRKGPKGAKLAKK